MRRALLERPCYHFPTVRLALPVLILVACAADPVPRVTPTRGRQSGGDPIRIEGRGFLGHGPPIVYLGNRAAKAVVVESGSLITARTPQSDDPTPVDVKVVFGDGTTVDIPEAFTYDQQEGVVLRPEIGG